MKQEDVSREALVPFLCTVGRRMDDGWADGNGVITMSLVVGTSVHHAPRPRTTNHASNFIN